MLLSLASVSCSQPSNDRMYSSEQPKRKILKSERLGCVCENEREGLLWDKALDISTLWLKGHFSTGISWVSKLKRSLGKRNYRSSRS